MAYAQWVVIIINNKSRHTAQLVNMAIEWGKFHAFGNKDVEIAPIALIQGKSYETISSCGKSNATSGTKGSFGIVLREQLIAKVQWDCPWGSTTNTFICEPSGTEFEDGHYQVSAEGASLSGALGTVYINIIGVPKGDDIVAKLKKMDRIVEEIKFDEPIPLDQLGIQIGKRNLQGLVFGLKIATGLDLLHWCVMVYGNVYQIAVEEKSQKLNIVITKYDQEKTKFEWTKCHFNVIVHERKKIKEITDSWAETFKYSVLPSDDTLNCQTFVVKLIAEVTDDGIDEIRKQLAMLHILDIIGLK